MTIYSTIEASDPLTQGDLIDNCPIVFWDLGSSGAHDLATTRERVVVLTQACDLAQSKATGVLVAIVHVAQRLVDEGHIKAKAIRDQIRTHRVYGWYFLPKGDLIEESLVDLRSLHTIPRSLLEQLVAQGYRITRIATPFREHMAQHFSTTYSRIALPTPYETESP